ncbi:Uncharacterized protein OS=Blastopirellula marina DSM 3645 GN=DSM3645_29311 PE=4 SV=1 [Gemmata massiliana]|uniref:Uncharacterized protein n=1 Tax=Gemmata massiliana TaxID=1210884 RepID=A0A6P2DBB8_9BACT|nr:hypothetical protein [Gemmata massiliana]VTR98250.1 Uncharacterized protein OS=Blastopirellula marina DSM 3645 GN=DSM3645_29311 PE=4 SV=1 [Gemmata massiliana]
MWTTQRTELATGLHFTVQRDDQPATFAEVLRALRTDTEFRSWLNALLAEAPFTAFRWETPAVTSATAPQVFEFVVLDAPHLTRAPNPDAFEEHFHHSPDAEVLDFPNLSGDAVLVVPRPIAGPSAYAHLAAFVRNAPESQRDALWARVGEAMAQRLGAAPVWLSTAGAGVPWLHVRLDNSPKYYGHVTYRRPAK